MSDENLDAIQSEVALNKVLALPCPSCAGKLNYSAEKQAILCQHCGYSEPINEARDRVVEHCLDEAITSLPMHSPEDEGQKVFDCNNCGAKFTVDTNRVKVDCGFCGSKNVNLEAFEHNYIEPMGIIPFSTPKEKAGDLFSD